MDNPDDRRKRQRFSIDGQASVQVLIPRVLRFFKPKVVDFGSIVDISTSGLAMVYIDEKMRSSKGESLIISMNERGITIPDITFTTVSDYKVSETEDDLVIRRRGIRFDRLTPRQAYHLRNFLENCAVGPDH